MAQTNERKRAADARRQKRYRARERRGESVLGVTLDLETVRDWAVETGRLTEQQARSKLYLEQIAKRIIETAMADSLASVTRNADLDANHVTPNLVDGGENEFEDWL